MKTFLRKLLLFCIPITLVAYPIDIYISNNLKQSNAYYGEYEVWNAIYNGGIETDIAIYGSSRAWVDISPEIIEDFLHLKAYNFGIDGHNFWLQYLRHKEFIKHNSAPKHIILAVDFSSLQKRKNLYLSEQFLPYMLWNKDIKNFTKSYEGYNILDYYVPLIRYIGKASVLEEAFKTSRTPYRTKGYKGIEKNWTNSLEQAKAKLTNYEIKIDLLTLNLFELFLKECRDNSIKVTLVYTPEYIEGQKFIKNRKVVIDKYINYAKNYNIDFVDYSMDSICFDKKYFYNSMHLNKIGSELFTKSLSKDLKALNLK